MTVTTQVTIGPVFSLTQDVAYALPARQVSVLALAAIEVSVDGSTWVTVATSTGGASIVGAFVRCHTGNTTAVFKL